MIARYTHAGGAICGLTWSPTKNLLAFTSIDGNFTRWTGAVPKGSPSPVTTDAQEQRRVERMLDEDGDDAGDDVDMDMDERGEDLGEDEGDAGDWIVDDDGAYAVDDAKWGKGRTEVGECRGGSGLMGSECDQGAGGVRAGKHIVQGQEAVSW